MKINQSYLLGGIILVLLITSLNGLFLISGNKQKTAENINIIDKNAYQAVFLSNNQIYFGHLSIESSDYLKLREVYYIQVIEGKNSKNRLVRLGDTEPHGPNNEMTLYKGNIIFWENLRSDSQVVQGIQTLKLQGK